MPENAQRSVRRAAAGSQQTMTETPINAGATDMFLAGILDDTLELDKRHIVQGSKDYQIAVQLIVTIPMVANQEYFIQNIRGQ